MRGVRPRVPRSDIFYIIDSKKRGELFELLQRFRLFGQAGEQGSEHRSGRSQHMPHRAQREHASRAQNAQTEASPDNGSQKHHSKKKHKLNKKQFLKFVVCVILAVALLGMTYVGVIIIKAPKIETGNIYSLLSQSSVLYDDKGEIIDNVFADQNRTIVEINQIPKDVQHAFIALEDKTFKTHHGFNIIRIFGAIKDAVLGGGSISGTSTITQQLARNLYLTDKMQERSLSRKITEA